MSIKLNDNIQTLGQKFTALKGLKSDLSNYGVALKYGVYKNKVSTWAKNENKTTHFSALDNLQNKLKKLKLEFKGSGGKKQYLVMSLIRSLSLNFSITLETLKACLFFTELVTGGILQEKCS